MLAIDSSGNKLLEFLDVTEESAAKQFSPMTVCLLVVKIALDQARTNGFEQVELGVFSDNDIARHMYKKMGFKEYGMNPRAFKLKDGTYRDEIVMANIFEGGNSI